MSYEGQVLANFVLKFQKCSLSGSRFMVTHAHILFPIELLKNFSSAWYGQAFVSNFMKIGP